MQQYCVTCHNDRLKTGDLVLTGIDASDARQHAAVLEKVVRKLRGGTMPPAGSPRPDAATLDGFIRSVETALDREAAASPNPGRVVSRRLNRSEYVNVVRDLLDLEVNGSELLPSDMAGFGFDNNADVLSMTPALMSRYIAAATKISRLALASPDNRAITQVYRVGFENRSARASDDLPFATRGGIAVRHAFPLDGEYVFKLRLKRNGTVSTIDGIDEDQHEVEIRIDHALVKRFTIGGEFKGPDPGVLIAVPEDDKYGQRLHDYRMNADDGMEVRLPIKAGTRLVAAAFTDAAPTPERIVRSRGRNGPGEVDGNAPGIDVLSISGPFDGRIPEDTPSRRRILTCTPTGAPASAQSASARQAGATARQAREEEDCARKILGTLARRAYRRPVTDEDVQPLVAIYKEGRATRDFDAGIERAVEALLSSPSFLFRAEQEPSGIRAGAAYRLSDLELASRLSFFLWRSIPDDELLDAAVAGQLKTPAGLARQVKRLLADKRSSRFMKDFSEQWLEVRNVQSKAPDSNLFSSFDDSLRKAMLKETELFFESQVREDRPVQDLLRADYTFLNEQLARHYGINDVFGGHFRRVTRDRRAAARVAGPRERADDDVVRESDLGRAARQVGAREPPGRTAAAAAAQRAAAQGERRQEQADRAQGAHGAAPEQPGLRELPLAHGSTRLRARTLRRGRPVARHRLGRRDQRVDHAARRGDRQPESVPRSTAHADRRIPAYGRRETPDLRAWPRPGLLRRAGRARARSRDEGRRIQMVVARPGHRSEPAVHDAASWREYQLRTSEPRLLSSSV